MSQMNNQAENSFSVPCVDDLSHENAVTIDVQAGESLDKLTALNDDIESLKSI
jgi:hypothetical protein